MTEMWQQGRDPLAGFRILRLGLNPDRAALYARINQRARWMFENGLVEETEGLLEKYGEALGRWLLSATSRPCKFCAGKSRASRRCRPRNRRIATMPSGR